MNRHTSQATEKMSEGANTRQRADNSDHNATAEKAGQVEYSADYRNQNTTNKSRVRNNSEEQYVGEGGDFNSGQGACPFKPYTSLRKGKWTVLFVHCIMINTNQSNLFSFSFICRLCQAEEEMYTNKVIETFNLGILKLAGHEKGITLRAYLANKLGTLYTLHTLCTV